MRYVQPDKVTSQATTTEVTDKILLEDIYNTIASELDSDGDGYLSVEEFKAFRDKYKSKR